MNTIAVLLTCYNRVQTTLLCLDCLFRQSLPEDVSLEVFLVDDASPDNTGQAVRGKFPAVHVIKGTGTLFWAGGMRMAWAAATAQADFDFYLWLNDDSLLEEGALRRLLENARLVPDAIVGGCFANPESGTIEYGALDMRAIPAGEGPFECFGRMHGNCVLVPRAVFRKIGGLSDKFVHGYADFEYALRARRNGIKTYLCRTPLGSCSPNKPIDYSYLRKLGLRARIREIHKPKFSGCGLVDYCTYMKMEQGWLAGTLPWLKGWLLAFFPWLSRFAP